MMTDGARWDRRFAAEPWPTQPDPYLVELAGVLSPGRGVDLGSGPGRNSLWLALRGWQMTLVDASAVGLTQAADRAATLGVTVTTLHADVSSWQPDPASFDLAIVANLQPEPSALAALLAAAARALTPGGHLYVVGHHVSSLGRHGPPDPDRLLTSDRLRQALPAGLALDLLDTRQRSRDQGSDRAAADADARPDSVVLAWATKTFPAGQ